MATYTTDLQLLNAADSATGWAELAGHTTGGAPAATTEAYIQNGTAVDQATGQALGTTAGVQYDRGTNITWTSGWVFLAWQFFGAPTAIDTWANGGMRIGIGSTSGNMNYWNAVGNDFGDYPYGGWQNTAIDPTFTPDATDGTPTAGAYRLYGSLPNLLVKITKGSPHVNDVIRYGRGQLLVLGPSATFTGMAAANDADTARWGLFQAKGGSYLWKGLMSLGQAATSVQFSDSNKSIRVDDTPRANATFNRAEIRNAASTVSWDSINFTGVQTSINGTAPISPGDFVVVDNATVNLTGCTFTDLGTFSFLVATTDLGGTYRRCKTIYPKGATMTDSLFVNTQSTNGAVQFDSTTDGENLSYCTFSNNTTGPAIKITQAGTYNFVGHQFSGNTWQVEFTGTGTCTIVPSGNSNVNQANVTATGGGTITVQTPQVNVTLTGLKTGSEVRAYVGTDPGTATVIGGIESSTTSFTFSQAVGGQAGYIVIHALGYNSIYLPITYSGAEQTIPIQQVLDRTYSNP